MLQNVAFRVTKRTGNAPVLALMGSYDLCAPFRPFRALKQGLLHYFWASFGKIGKFGQLWVFHEKTPKYGKNPVIWQNPEKHEIDITFYLLGPFGSNFRN